MLGRGSIPLARVFGIRIGVHASWFLILFLIIYSFDGYFRAVFPGADTLAFVLATASALLFFLSVLLHELGHAVVAVRNGIAIAGIDLFLFGGVAKMTRDADSPGVDFRVAVAGPLVTLLIAAGSLGAGALLSGGDSFGRILGIEVDGTTSPVGALFGNLTFINGALLVFNLIPGLPLDGGRIARAIAWGVTGDRLRATRFAALLGRGFAYLLMGFGVFLSLNGELIGGLWFVFIGFFIAGAARSAEAQARVTSRIEGLKVADVMDDDPVAVPGGTRLDRALDEFFLRYQWPWFPVTDATGHFLGLLSRERVDDVPEPARRDRLVDEVMTADDGGALRIRHDEPLEALLGYEALRSLGALMVVDGEGVLRGVVTIGQVRRALGPVAPVA